MSTAPRPWTIAPHPDDAEFVEIVADYTELANGNKVAHWIASCESSADIDMSEDEYDAAIRENIANAKLIVRAVNCHDDLLAALKAAQQFLSSDVERGPDVNGWENTVDLVAAAIAKAEGRTDPQPIDQKADV